MTDITEQQQAQLLADPSIGYFAPMVLWQPMQRLAGGASEVKAAAVSCLETDHKFQWTVVWLTGDVIVHGAAVKTHHEGFWSAYSEDQECEQVTVWARRLDQIASVESVALSVESETRLQSKWVWTEAYQIRFLDGSSLRLPVFDNLPAGRAATMPTLNLLNDLIAQWSRGRVSHR